METLEAFACRALAGFDKSHDYEHSVRVLANAQNIIDLLCYQGEYFDPIERDIITYACILHDTIDHKYVGQRNVTPDDVSQFVEGKIGYFGATVCMNIINNISWSKNRRGENKPLRQRDILRLVVQCADWIDALGAVGIERARDYGLTHGSTLESVDRDIVRHIEEKLGLIQKNLPLDVARELAAGPHEEVIQWYHEHK